LKGISISAPESVPSVAIYHPEAPKLFESLGEYQAWYEAPKQRAGRRMLEPDNTIGLLLLRPQVVSKSTRHYDQLIRAIEAEGLAVIPVLTTLMDNREACERFFMEQNGAGNRAKKAAKSDTVTAGTPRNGSAKPQVSQILSLTGFSFVGGPAMNDS